jgi:hypothetical protein
MPSSRALGRYHALSCTGMRMPSPWGACCARWPCGRTCRIHRGSCCCLLPLHRLLRSRFHALESQGGGPNEISLFDMAAKLNRGEAAKLFAQILGEPCMPAPPLLLLLACKSKILRALAMWQLDLPSREAI